MREDHPRYLVNALKIRLYYEKVDWFEMNMEIRIQNIKLEYLFDH